MYLFYWKWSVIWAIDFLTAREPVWNLKRCWRVCWRVCWRASRGGVFPLETLRGSVVHFKECKWSIVIPWYSQIFAFALPSMNEAVLGKRTAKVGQRVWLGQKVWKPKFPKWVLVCKDFFPPGWCVCVCAFSHHPDRGRSAFRKPRLRHTMSYIMLEWEVTSLLPNQHVFHIEWSHENWQNYVMLAAG